ncbi:uncharacterized protein [Dermacentor albipictus]|uniref:uncharacterized protein n=1 Tax=Dermacentor albipictus TaxID=60249 RepID=UPI0038FC8D0B
MSASQSLRRLAVTLMTCAFALCHAEENPDCSIQRLRACGSSFVVFGNTTTIAETPQELREACRVWTSEIECSLKYIDDCLEGTTRGTCLVVIKAAEEDFEAICTEGSDMEKQYHLSAPCGNSVGTKLNGCVRGMYHNLQKAVEKAASNQAVHHACCYFGELLECVDSSLDSCDNADAPKQFIMGRLEHIFGESLSLVCGTHTRGSASCAALPVLPELEPGAPEPVSNLVEYGILIMRLFSRRDNANQ